MQKSIAHKYPALARALARQGICSRCGGELDTGWECNDCGYDAMDDAYPQNLRDIDKKYLLEGEE